MKKKILLNWLPPSMEYCASPALSVLKDYLTKEGFEVTVKYWNLSLYPFLEQYLNLGKSIEVNDAFKMLPFYVNLAIENDDFNKLDDLAYYILSQKPQLNAKGLDYLKSYFITYNEKLNSLIEEQLTQFNFEDYLYIGFSSQFYQWIVAVILAKRIRRKNPQIKIVIGGFGTNNEAESFMNNFQDFDYASWGEGEISLSRLSLHLLGHFGFEKIPNTFYRDGQELKCNKIKNEYIDLDNTSFDVSDFVKQIKSVHLKHPLAIGIETSRGCHWHKCHFCFLNKGYKYRKKSVDSIIAEIRRQIEATNILNILFLDNDIIGNDQKRFDKLLDGLISIRNDYNDFAVVFAEIVTQGLEYDIIKKMGLANFQSVQIGYESPSANLLKKIDKKNSFASNLFFLKWGARFNIGVSGINILRNLLEEDDDDIKEGIGNLHSLRFLFYRKVFSHNFSYLGIAKTSPYYKIIEKDQKLSEWNNSFIYSMLPNNFINEEDKYSLLFDFIKSSYNHLWDTFRTVEAYYLNNKYDYSLFICDKVIYYKEWYNGVMIKELEFEENGIHWFILDYCNQKISSLSELLNLKDALFSDELMISAISELQSEGLIYCNIDFTEILTIIDTNLVK